MLTVCAAGDDYIPVDPVEVEFRLVQESLPLFVVTDCQDFQFLRFYMMECHLVAMDAPLNVTESFSMERGRLIRDNVSGAY
ncbi:hypothetical protein JTE90_018322 [Oedothorax gibbosus]|uniref:Uncharacterized protein n=1 Tax=Oedothorax gibbosus TaxID=931172 RepID=A0AAV6U0D4_9ARAC|nr:hypothetical protein JTE90_018322 [Oedothorax gibbosus]